jgi:hypothetical protein
MSEGEVGCDVFFVCPEASVIPECALEAAERYKRKYLVKEVTFMEAWFTGIH